MKILKYIFALFFFFVVLHEVVSAKTSLLIGRENYSIRKDESNSIFGGHLESSLFKPFSNHSIYQQGYFLESSKPYFENTISNFYDVLTSQILTIRGSQNSVILSFINGSLEDGKRVEEHVFNGDEELADGWKKLDEIGVDDAIKKNPLHLEVTNKLDELNMDPNVSEANKLIKNINEGLAQAGEKGVEVANKIKSGVYDQVEGYKDLIKQIKKSGDVNPDLNNNVIPVRQALNKFDEFSDVPADRKFFEIGKANPDGTPLYDIDFGVKDANGNIIVGYQLKKANTTNAIKNNSLRTTNIDQIKNSPALDKRFEIELLTGGHSDIGQDVIDLIELRKIQYTDVKFYINANGVVKQY